MWLAVFTVSPHTSWLNFRCPIIPAMTGPQPTPMRSCRGSPAGVLTRVVASPIAIARSRRAPLSIRMLRSSIEPSG